MLDLTGVDGVSLARGLYGRPWLFKQVKEFLLKGKYRAPTLEEIKKTALEHAELNYKTKGKHGIVEMRKHLCWYFRGFPGAANLRTKLVRVESIDDVKKALKEL
jgi:tRNA-dihydrouridine synthase